MRPDPVKLLVKKVTDRTVTVIWIPDFNGGATITNYIIEIKEKQREHSSTAAAVLAETAGV